jgi:uncharacterized paraquat-inducible protein A
MIRMTAKEAEKILFNMADYVEFDEDYGVLFRAPLVDATVRAVKALREEVVHGRWIDNIDENGYLCNAWRKCSACGGLNWSKRPNYCPNCGAKMGLEDK